jgi:hypothetical protein
MFVDDFPLQQSDSHVGTTSQWQGASDFVEEGLKVIRFVSKVCIQMGGQFNHTLLVFRRGHKMLGAMR